MAPAGQQRNFYGMQRFCEFKQHHAGRHHRKGRYKENASNKGAQITQATNDLWRRLPAASWPAKNNTKLRMSIEVFLSAIRATLGNVLFHVAPL